MASRVFGNPITDATLQAMPDYIGKAITATDRAHVALTMKNSENKDVNSRTFVDNLKRRYGKGVSTLCLIYNATGGTLTFVDNHDWHGRIGEAPYPITIANGQWGAYLHVKKSLAITGSVAAAVYRGQDSSRNGRDWMLAWNNPLDRVFNKNSVYTEIREAKYYETDHWKDIYDKLKNNGRLTYCDTWGGCESSVSTGSSFSPMFEGVMTLVGAEKSAFDFQ